MHTHPSPLHRLLAVLIGAVLCVGVAVTAASPASAAPTGRVVASPSLTLRADATTASSALGSIPHNTSVAIQCTKRGATVNGNWGATNLWDKVSYGGRTGFVSDGWLYTGSNGPVAADCGSTPPPPPVASSGTGRIMASPSLTLRADASPASAALGTVPYNAVVSIQCTKRGTTVTGRYGASNLWDRIAYGGRTGFVADSWVYTGTANPVARDCGGSTPAPASTKAQKALAWARAQLGATGWNGWCDRFVANAYGKANSGYASAYVHYQDMKRRGLIRTTGTPPVGALVFYGPASANRGYGHVMISEGNGSYISTAATVRRVSQSWPNAPYLGWSDANPEWPGR